MAFKNRHYPEAGPAAVWFEARYQALKAAGGSWPMRPGASFFWWLETFFTGRGCLAKLLPG